MKWFACLIALPFIATAAAAQSPSASAEAAQPAAKTYPPCSATVTDSCMQRSASATSTHTARHHRHHTRTAHPRQG